MTPAQLSVAKLLTAGGDRRIACAPGGRNKYGCAPFPQAGLLSYSSSTASTISPQGFAAAAQLHDRLLREEIPPSAYAREMDRIRAELLRLNGLSSTAIVFGASGTDLHLLASALVTDPEASGLLTLMVEPAETGSGVHAATQGRHFSDCAAFAPSVARNMPLRGVPGSDIATVACRMSDGMPRASAVIDGEVAAMAQQAVSAGMKVLLVLIDVSKTGLIAPSLACAIALKKRFPDAVEVLVDACQFRIAPSTLRAYLQQDFLVAITGSKFVGGPAFSGALLVPEAATQRLARRNLPVSFADYSAQADWPEGWAARQALRDDANYGLLLRWEAALAELRAFHVLPTQDVARFLTGFAAAISNRLAADPAFEPLPMPELDRSAVTATEDWDRIQTIFPFTLRRSHAETARIYERLRENNCFLGQPVICGTQSALRLCLSMPLIVDALSHEGRGAQAVITEALSLLDKTATLAATHSHPNL